MSEISIVLLSELIVSVPNTDKCSSDESKTTYTITLVTNMKVAESLLVGLLFRAALALTSWPSGKRAGYKARGPGSIPGCAPIFSVFFLSFLTF